LGGILLFLLLVLAAIILIILICIEVIPKLAFEVFFSDDGGVVIDDALFACGLEQLGLVGVLDDPVAANVAAGYGALVQVLRIVVVILVDGHRSAVDRVRTIQSGLPGGLVVPGITGGVMDHGVQVADLARPVVHLAEGLIEGVPGGLRGLAVPVVEPVLLD
jgi:hypothetical protein